MRGNKVKDETMSSASSNRHAGTAEVHAGRDREAGEAESGPSFPIYFDSDGHSLFGWFQGPPAHSMAEVGLVICKPFGYEAICAHRSLRAFADAAAAVGVPTLRVDYRGTGDSAPIDPEADQVKVWTRDVIAAVLELRRRTGVRQVGILGVRLGALLAILAAEECAGPTPLVLIAPVVTGRRYLRDLRTTRLAALMGRDAPAADPAAPEVSDGSMEVSGFPLSAATLATLALLDLQTREPPTSDVLLIDGKSLPVAAALARQWTERGVRTTYASLPGLIEMLMTAPQYATIPREMIQDVRAWLRHIVDSSWARPTSRSVQAPPAASDVLTLRRTGPAPLDPLTERPLFFGSDSAIFGIITEPPPGELRRRAVIMLNAGADLHVGVHGMNVFLARQWASRGYVVLRIDLAGLGDSRTRPGQTDNDVFPAAALDDIRAAVQLLRDRYAVGDVSLFGLCSGAYHALRAAADGVAVNRILMVNPLNYFWKSGTNIDSLQLADVVRNAAGYRQRLTSWAAWKRLISGKVEIGRIARIYLTRPLLAVGTAVRDVARLMGIRLQYDLGRELQEIDARGVKMVFVFARGEPGLDLLKIEAGSVLRRLGERCRVRIIEDADHSFSQAGPRAVLHDILSDELFAGPRQPLGQRVPDRAEEESMG
jgi:alpha-beta hydrolase superfamily lysophospholipase